MRASAAGAPASTVDATRSSAPAFAIDSISNGVAPSRSASRARRAAGSSGSAAASDATQPASGASGTRSGSGKYR